MPSTTNIPLLIDLNEKNLSISLLGELVKYEKVNLFNVSREDISLLKSALEFYANLSDKMDHLIELGEKLKEADKQRTNEVKRIILEQQKNDSLYQPLQPIPTQIAPFQQQYWTTGTSA